MELKLLYRWIAFVVVVVVKVWLRSGQWLRSGDPWAMTQFI